MEREQSRGEKETLPVNVSSMKHHEDSYSTKFSISTDCDNNVNYEFQNESDTSYDSDDNVCCDNSMTLGSASSVYYSLSSIPTEASETCLSFFASFFPLSLSLSLFSSAHPLSFHCCCCFCCHCLRLLTKVSLSSIITIVFPARQSRRCQSQGTLELAFGQRRTLENT